MMEQQEKLMARVIDIFAQTFDKKAVLRGGMVLRLLGAPRCTNDLYYLQMNISPDEKTLLQRLKKPSYSRLVRKDDHFAGSSLTEFYTFLRQKCADLNADDIRAELSGYLPSDEIDGLDLLFRAALTKLS